MLPQSLDSVVNIYQPDPVVGYIYKPKATARETGREYEVTYTTNSLGLRDREYDLENKNVFRIMLLGDSFAESHGLQAEDGLARKIEDFLRQELAALGAKARVEVVNVSFGGYSPYHYWKSYGRWKSIFQPKALIIAFYMGNDYLCEDEGIQYTFADGEIVGQRQEGHPVPTKRKGDILTIARKWLAKNSELYVLMRNYIYYNDLIGKLTKWAKARESSTQLAPYLVPQSPLVEREKEKCLKYLRNLAMEAAKDDVHVFLLAIPVKFEIVAENLDMIVSTQGVDFSEIDLDQPYRDLKSFCLKERVFFVDPRPAMKSSENSKKSNYFKYDGHWNEKGVSAAAQSIVNAWREAVIPPFGREPEREGLN
jgi:hypothetical protein